MTYSKTIAQDKQNPRVMAMDSGPVTSKRKLKGLRQDWQKIMSSEP